MLSLSVADSVTAANLLKNGNMEDGTKEWIVPSWLKNTIPAVADTMVNAGGGNTSLKLQGVKGKRVIVYHNFEIPGNCRFIQVRAMAKTRNLGNTWSAITLEVQNVKKSPWSISTYPRSQNKAETEWMEYVSPVIELPSGAGPMAKIYLQIASGAEGTVWFDDITVTPLKSKSEGMPEVGELPVAKKKAKSAAEVKTIPAGVGKPSGYSILSPNWALISWLPDAARPLNEGGDLVFRLKAGQRALSQQRIMGIAANVTGDFRYSAWVKAPAGVFPVMNATPCAVYTVNRKPVTYYCKPTGAVKDGFREFSCTFFAPEDNGEIRVSAGISGKSSKAGDVIFRDIKLEPLTRPGNEIRILYAGNDERQNILYPGELPFANFLIQNQSAREQTVTFDCSLRNLRGKEIQKFTRKVDLPAQDIVLRKIEFPEQSRFGYYSVHLTWNNLKEKKENIVSFVKVPRFDRKKDPFFGITFMAHNAEYAVALNRLGAGSKGLYINWSDVELFDGSYDWSRVDRDLEALLKEGVEPIGGLEVYTGRYPYRYAGEISERKKQKLFPFSEKFFENAMKFERAVFQRYRGKIKHWAVIGEIDLLKERNNYEYEYYIRRVKGMSKALRSVTPENTLSGIGCSGGDGRALPRYPVLRDLWYKHGLSEALDGLGIDQYTTPLTYGPGYKPVNSETGQIREIMLEALRIAKSKGKNKTVSIDEKGFNIVQSLPVDSPYGVSMAENIARYYITIKSIPEVQHFLYFMWKRWRLGEEFDFGLYLDRFPRQKVAAYAAAARIMAHAKCVKVMSLHSNIPCYIFDNGKQRIIPLWHGGTGIGKAGVSIAVPGDLQMIDMEGNPVKPDIVDGQLKLQLDSAPVYLLTSSKVSEVEKIIRTASVELPSVSMELVLKKTDELEVLVKNLFAAPVSGTISMKNKFADFRQAYTIPGNGLSKIRIPLKNSDPAAVSGYDFVVENTSAQKQVYRKNDMFHVHVIPQVKSQADVGKGDPLVDLSNGELYLNIPDFISKGVWTGPEDCSAKLWMGYDAKNLYMKVEVRDEFHTNRYHSSDTLWAGDSLQFAFDSNLDAREKVFQGRKGLFDDDFFMTAALTDRGPLFFCQNTGHGKGDWSRIKPVIKRDNAKKTTTFEITLPWPMMAPITPQKGRMFGFNFLAMDTDNPTTYSAYWMQLTPGIAGGRTPEKFHTFVLQ